MIWPTARPTTHAARVICAVPGAVWNVASTAGNAGKCISIAAGPTAMKITEQPAAATVARSRRRVELRRGPPGRVERCGLWRYLAGSYGAWLPRCSKGREARR